MAIGAIIMTSLSYASQMSVAEYICNAERFDNKAGPFVGSIMETILRMQMVSKTPSAKNYPASDTAPLRPDARDVESASPASCAP